jgi:hypothetical protein
MFVVLTTTAELGLLHCNRTDLNSTTSLYQSNDEVEPA